MEKYDVYKDIAERCDGDVYIGVVGPCRTGKSTFISKFVESAVLPNIRNKHNRERVKDELPQSGSGRQVMTTEPKFIPGEAVSMSLDKKIDVNVRMIDCVGYLVDGINCNDEDGNPRMVKTPWSETEMPFAEAAELGTNKVIREHSNLGIVVTTDGTITDIPREAYIKAEERVVNEIKTLGKPFVIVMNSKAPNGEFATSLTMNLREKYNVPVIPLNLLTMTKQDAEEVMAEALREFDLKKVEVEIPSWMQALPYENHMIQEIMNELKSKCGDMHKMSDEAMVNSMFDNMKYFETPQAVVKMGEGLIYCDMKAVEGLFYQVISSECGVEIKNDFELVSALKDLLTAKTEYDKIKQAMQEVKDTGYGVVMPSLSEMTLEEPCVTEKNGQYGVRLRASAPSLHMMRVDVDTEINPVVGNKAQGEDLINSLLQDYDTDPNSIWETNLFGKPLNLVVKDGLNNKLAVMPQEVKHKMRKTIGRIVNEGKGGVICILL